MARSGANKASPPGLVAVGRIGAAHGVRGEVRLQSFCAEPGDILAYGPLETEMGGKPIEFAALRPAKGHFVARIKGVSDRNAAEKLNGVVLYVPRERLPETEDPDEFYYSDLIGLEVRQADGTVFGEVKNVDNFGAGELLLIKLAAGGEEYFAFTEAVFPEMHLSEGFVLIAPPASVEAREGS